MDKIEKQIEDLIYSFFTAMNEWEKFCYKIDHTKLPFEDKTSKQTEEAKKIVDKFLTKKQRKMGLPNCISYGHKGCYNYNPKEEKIISIEIEKNKAVVTTERIKPMEENNRYILKKIKDSWLIDSKKHFSWKEKWENAII